MRCASRPSAATWPLTTSRAAASSWAGCCSSAPIWAVASTPCWPTRWPAAPTSRCTGSSRCTTTRGSIQRWWLSGPRRAGGEPAAGPLPRRANTPGGGPAVHRRPGADMTRILIVKTSSMGDVVHALPAVSDMQRALPGLQVDWLVEAPFAAIPRLHAGVARVLPLAWRKWRKQLLAPDTRSAIAALRAELKREPYDLVLDLQGLLKRSEEHTSE